MHDLINCFRFFQNSSIYNLVHIHNTILVFDLQRKNDEEKDQITQLDSLLNNSISTILFNSQNLSFIVHFFFYSFHQVVSFYHLNRSILNDERKESLGFLVHLSSCVFIILYLLNTIENCQYSFAMGRNHHYQRIVHSSTESTIY